MAACRGQGAQVGPAGIPPCYVAPELIRPTCEAAYMVEIDGNVYSVPWRLIGKAMRATVIGGKHAHPPPGGPLGRTG